MRILNFVFLFLTILMISCNQGDKAGKNGSAAGEGSSENIVMDENESEKAAREMQEKAEELVKLAPTSEDDMKALLPDELLGGKRSSIQTTTAMGTGSAMAQYDINDSTQLVVTIYDCGGPGGAGMYTNNYKSLFDTEKTTDTETKRIVEFDGKKGIEQCSKIEKACNLTYFTGKRFLISLNGDGLGGDELVRASEELIQ